MALTRNDWFKVQRFKDACYLYAVMNAATLPQLYMVRDPAEPGAGGEGGGGAVCGTMGRNQSQRGENSMTKDDIIEALQKAKNEARERYRAEIMGFFGSYARGEEHADSDLDVLVEFRKGATLLHLTGLGNFLEERLNCPVDIVSQRAVRKEIAPHIYDDLVSL